MANSYQPIFSGIPSTPSGGQLTNTAPAALTTSDGVTTIGTNSIKIFTSAATYGSYLSSIRFSPYATTASTATTATIFRVYLSSVTSGVTTAANTWLIAEVSAASQTAAPPTNSTYFIEVPINRALPPGYTILVTQHAVCAASTGWQCVPWAGDYVATP